MFHLEKLSKINYYLLVHHRGIMFLVLNQKWVLAWVVGFSLCSLAQAVPLSASVREEADQLSKTLIQTCRQVSSLNPKLTLHRCYTQGLSEVESVQGVLSQLKRSKFEASREKINFSNLKKLSEGLQHGRFFVSADLHEKLSARYERITKAYQTKNKKVLDAEVEQASLVLDQVRAKVIRELKPVSRGVK